MPRSLKTRFNGNGDEVVDYTRLWGRYKAMEKYDVKDYLAFSKFIEGKTGDSNLGISPALGSKTDRSWADDMLDAFVNKVSKMEAEKQSLKEEIHRLRTELEYYKGSQAMRLQPKISQVMKACAA